MTSGPNGPVIDNLADIRLELMQLNLYIRDLLTVSQRELPAPVVNVAPAPVVVESAPVSAVQPLNLDGLYDRLASLRGDPAGSLEQLQKLNKQITDLTVAIRAGMGGSYGVASGSSHVTAEVYSKAGLTVKTEEATKDSRYEWQTVNAERKPLYIGTAAPGSATSAEVWSVQKYTFSGDDLSLVQTRSGSWDSRTTLF